MKILDAISAVLELSAAETATGTRLVEAVAADSFQTELRAVTDSEEARQRIREAAIELAKVGIAGCEEVHDMVRLYRIAELYDIDEDDLRAIGRIKRAAI